MVKTSRTTAQVGQQHPVARLSKKIDQTFGADRSRNPCVIKHCPAKQGYGVFARRDLKKGTLVAYYVIKLSKHFTKTPSPTKGMYVTDAPASPSNPEKNSRTFFGDIGQDAGDVFGRHVFKGKPVCGHVINEPGMDEIENCHMPTTTWDASLLKDGTGRRRAVFKAGDVVFHNIKTFRAVKKGEELITVYGDDYERNYKVGKKFAKK